VSTPDDKIEQEYVGVMSDLAFALDRAFNGEATGAARKTGFFLLVFPYGEEAKGRANYISNGGDRKDIATLMREMAARFEGQPEMTGRG
jgi:hypothetical protein